MLTSFPFTTGSEGSNLGVLLGRTPDAGPVSSTQVAAIVRALSESSVGACPMGSGWLTVLKTDSTIYMRCMRARTDTSLPNSMFVQKTMCTLVIGYELQGNSLIHGKIQNTVGRVATEITELGW